MVTATFRGGLENIILHDVMCISLTPIKRNERLPWQEIKSDEFLSLIKMLDPLSVVLQQKGFHCLVCTWSKQVSLMLRHTGGSDAATVSPPSLNSQHYIKKNHLCSWKRPLPCRTFIRQKPAAGVDACAHSLPCVWLCFYNWGQHKCYNTTSTYYINDHMAIFLPNSCLFTDPADKELVSNINMFLTHNNVTLIITLLLALPSSPSACKRSIWLFSC